ncbi:MAG: TPM domain-containing protein [Flammeovirgaceae bacterium]|nr:MAG: TPM domain-containing protein [Flammeovirgaceae bacterium]
MKKIVTLCVVAALAIAGYAQTYTVETVPNTKLVNNSYVSDPARILHDTTVARINQLLTNLEKSATAQVAVVMLPSIGSDEHVDFAQRLFRHWGIGQASNDNGLLILFILDQRTIRFHTGYGVEGILTDATCKRIQQRHMVPHFKNGDYNTGMLRGIEATVTILQQPEAIEEITAQNDAVAGIGGLYFFLGGIYGIILIIVVISRLIKSSSRSTDRFRLSWKRWFLYYALVPGLYVIITTVLEPPFFVFIAGFYILMVTLFIERYFRAMRVSESILKELGQQDAYNFLNRQKSYWISALVVAFIPMIFIYLNWRKKKNYYRNRPLICKKCQSTMRKLSEAEEDEFMHTGQIAEEKAGTVDHDVWQCAACGSTESLRYPNATTKFTHCPKCNFLTYYFGARRTIQSATYTAAGYGEEERTCLHCGHHHIDKYIIPMLVASSSGSSSSSSSSGGSWGGGSSGGGGASSSW